MKQIFVTGMLRSGTSLIQSLLTNHPQLFVIYQPYHQFYVDIKQKFLDEYGLKKSLPLGDDMDTNEHEKKLFNQWLCNRHFNCSEVNALIATATQGKGGSATALAGNISILSGTFFEIQYQLHKAAANYFGRSESQFIGAKEVLCEEYVSALSNASVRCLLIIRDPRAVIASANYGRYQESVGDRYPLLMLIRLWRKSAAYWLAFRNHPLVHTIRYEDLISQPEEKLSEIAKWLDTAAFPKGMIYQPLHDHAGNIWKGNSSFGDKIGVENSGCESWRTLLTIEEIRFIEICTKSELSMLGYSYSEDLQRRDILEFNENLNQVRESYLSIYGLNESNKRIELQRWESGSAG